MDLSLKEYLFLCLQNENKEILDIINPETIAEYYRQGENNGSQFVWQKLSLKEISILEVHMDTFFKNTQIGGDSKETKDCNKNNKHIRYVDLSNKNISDILEDLNTIGLRSELLNLECYYYDAAAVKTKLKTLNIHRLNLLKRKLCIFLFVINEILHRNNFWRKYYKFEDRNNLIAHCVFNNKILFLLFDNHYYFYKNVEELIETKKYLPMYDIIHKHLISYI